MVQEIFSQRKILGYEETLSKDWNNTLKNKIATEWWDMLNNEIEGNIN